MITGKLKSQIDKLWEKFWTGGITNPLTVIEQISFLMFARLLDVREKNNESMEKEFKIPAKKIFTPSQQKLRWSHFQHLGGDEMLPVVRELFDSFKLIVNDGSSFREYMKDAQLMIQKPNLLVEAVNMVNELPLTEGDTKGDLYEYLLSKLTTAGINGQFRTPRHIIRLMVDLLDPKPNESFADPACGTAGFLVSVMQYLLEKYTSPEMVIEGEEGERFYAGDLLEPFKDNIQSDLLHGFDFDITMLRIAAMNLMLHGIDSPHIHYQDTLSSSFYDHFSTLAENRFDGILANPPFKGSLDEDRVARSLIGKVKTKKTELLFITLMLRMLKLGGRCATIVPDGVLFGASKAHFELRKTLIEENQLEAVISLPSGVFRPYAGVSTAIIVFTKGGSTEKVWFYDLKADGYSLDDKRDKIDENDIPDLLDKWNNRLLDNHESRVKPYFFIPLSDIKEMNYDLSVNKYRKIEYVAEAHNPPLEILYKIKTIELEIHSELEMLEKVMVTIGMD